MYFQFLVEDKSTEILVSHIMIKLKEKYLDKSIQYDCKSFKGIGHLSPKGTVLEQKTGKLLNDLPMYLRGFNKALASMADAALIIIMDNDKRDTVLFKQELEEIAVMNMVCIDYVYCIAVKELEAWLLGDEAAIRQAYPNYRKKMLGTYTQDGIGETWETLANAVYKDGKAALMKKANGSYKEIGIAKCEWAEKIGSNLDIEHNNSPSFNYFIRQLIDRIEKAA